jgi:hypothetical protein
MNQSEKDLLKMQHPNREALITVFGKVDEGTDIYIAELSLRLNSPMEAVTFYYKKDGPELAVRDITAADKAGTAVNDTKIADTRPSETDDSPESAEQEEENASSDSQVEQ